MPRETNFNDGVQLGPDRRINPDPIQSPPPSREDANLMRDAAADIEQLRRRNEILEARVEVMDLFAWVLGSKPPEPQSVGMAVDVADKLRRRAGGYR